MPTTDVKKNVNKPHTIHSQYVYDVNRCPVARVPIEICLGCSALNTILNPILLVVNNDIFKKYFLKKLNTFMDTTT